MGVEIGLGRNIVCSRASLCPCLQPPFLKHFQLSSASTKFNIRLISVASNGNYGIPVWILLSCRTIMAVARAEPDRFVEELVKEEVVEGCDLLEKEDYHLEEQHKASQLKSRVISGLAIGFSGGGVILAGGWIFTAGVAAAAFIAAREYFGLVRSDGIAVGMTPPPRYVSRVCSVICALMPLWTLYAGHIDISVTSAAFIVVISLLLQRGNPRFAQLSSAMFGLFYCGYLPCFWVKLRCGLSLPAR
ncbi:Phosphatidate cytidylyltransferase 5 chloroplastic [Bienertia sinuspersici]